MGLTLNIIEHELQAYGRVERMPNAPDIFSDFRLFVESVPLVDREEVLYLCSTRADVGLVTDAGHNALYVSTIDSAPDPRAILSVLQGESILVVLNVLLDMAFRFGSWEHSMDDIYYTGGTLQDLIDISTPFLQNNVVVLDPAFKLLAYTKDVPCDDPITMELIKHGYHTEENISKFKLNKRFKPWSEQHGFIINDTYKICKYVTVVKSFKTKLSFSLIIVMMCNVVDAEDYLLDIYSLFAERVRLFAQRDYPDDKPSGNAVDTFIRDLALGKPLAIEAAYERSESLGIPHEAPFCLFYMKADSDSVPTPRLLVDVSRLVAPAKTVLIDDAIVVLCFDCRSNHCAMHCASNTCPLGHTSLSSRIEDTMVKYGFVCGRSSKFTELAKLSIAFKQAEWAYHISKKRLQHENSLGIEYNWTRIATFDSCNVDYLVKSIEVDEFDLVRATYAGYVLDQIYNQDFRSKTDNYKFLYEYLMDERRAGVVAEKLHMHRNNVKYRIDHIEEQFGIDTSDPMLRFDFLLAYRIRESSVIQSAQWKN